MIEFGNLEHGWAIADAIPRRFNPLCDPVISHVSDDGVLLGGVTYDSFTGNCIFMHQAGFSKRWLTRDLLWCVFDYPFNQLGCTKVCGTIPSYREGLLAFNERLGFKVEARIKDAYIGGDMLILSMERDACRWLDHKPQSLRSNKQGSVR